MLADVPHPQIFDSDATHVTHDDNFSLDNGLKLYARVIDATPSDHATEVSGAYHAVKIG
jgi:hypothetical protein